MPQLMEVNGTHHLAAIHGFKLSSFWFSLQCEFGCWRFSYKRYSLMTWMWSKRQRQTFGILKSLSVGLFHTTNVHKQVSKPKRINCWVMKFRLWIKLCNSFDYSLELDIQLDLHICVYNLCVQFVCTIGITHLCVLVKNRFFFKKMGQTRPHFVYFRSFHMTNIAQIQKWKKCRLCTWDSNPGQQNGRHRWIHWAMAAPHN